MEKDYSEKRYFYVYGHMTDIERIAVALFIRRKRTLEEFRDLTHNARNLWLNMARAAIDEMVLINAGK